MTQNGWSATVVLECAISWHLCNDIISWISRVHLVSVSGWSSSLTRSDNFDPFNITFYASNLSTHREKSITASAWVS